MVLYSGGLAQKFPRTRPISYPGLGTFRRSKPLKICLGKGGKWILGFLIGVTPKQIQRFFLINLAGWLAVFATV